MGVILAQADVIQDGVSDAIKGASQYSGEVWLASIIVIGMFCLVGILGGMYLYYVQIPRSKKEDDRYDIQAKAYATLSQCVAELSKLNADTHESTKRVVEHTEMIRDRIEKTRHLTNVLITVFEKIADKVGIDISKELGRIQGILQDN